MQPSASVSSGCDYSRLCGDAPAPCSCQCRPGCFCHVTEREEQHGAGYVSSRWTPSVLECGATPAPQEAEETEKAQKTQLFQDSQGPFLQ